MMSGERYYKNLTLFNEATDVNHTNFENSINDSLLDMNQRRKIVDDLN